MKFILTVVIAWWAPGPQVDEHPSTNGSVITEPYDDRAACELAGQHQRAVFSRLGRTVVFTCDPQASRIRPASQEEFDGR